MRRSEMIAVIESYGLPYYVLSSNEVDRLQLADRILKLIEEQGMLPPEIDETIEGHLCSDNRWEEEHEEK